MSAGVSVPPLPLRTGQGHELTAENAEGPVLTTPTLRHAVPPLLDQSGTGMPASSTIADPAHTAHLSSEHDTPSGVLSGVAGDLIAELWKPRFPSAELVDQAAALLPVVHAAGQELLTEGPRPFIRVGPGVLEVRTKDYARADRTHEREHRRHLIEVDQDVAYYQQHGEFPEDPEPTRAITEWSRKSQTNMIRALGMLDFTPMYVDRSRIPAMLTLTYPGDWLTVAPTGKAVKAHLKALRKRYERAWEERLYAVWKLEFQARGAPHVHLLIVPPHGEADGMPFRQWVSWAWADIVAHPDPEERRKHLLAGTGVDYAEGLRATDPRRVGVYFLKHSTFKDKAYQHIVPEEWHEPGTTPGRFWGYWSLRKHTATVEVDERNGDLAGRTLRRWSAAQQVTREVSRPRVKGGRVISKYPEVIGLAGAQLVESRGEPKYRKTRTRARRMRANRGFVMVNDGPAMASQLARYLDQRAEQVMQKLTVFASHDGTYRGTLRYRVDRSTGRTDHGGGAEQDMQKLRTFAQAGRGHPAASDATGDPRSE